MSFRNTRKTVTSSFCTSSQCEHLAYVISLFLNFFLEREYKFKVLGIYFLRIQKKIFVGYVILEF